MQIQSPVDNEIENKPVVSKPKPSKPEVSKPSEEVPKEPSNPTLPTDPVKHKQAIPPAIPIVATEATIIIFNFSLNQKFQNQVRNFLKSLVIQHYLQIQM